ncbi:hypothetical protein CSUI_009148, partial [Cystoisospora suis]
GRYSLPSTFRRWISTLLPRSFVELTRTDTARHMFICSWALKTLP